jgi:hypothetical protein
MSNNGTSSLLHNHTAAAAAAALGNASSVCGGGGGGGGGGSSSDAGSGDFWVGVVAALIGSVTLNLGLNMQKLAFVRLERTPAATRRNPWMDPLWLAGLVVFLVGNAGDAIGLTFTAQSVITPLGQISLVSNIYFAWLLVGEKVDKATVGATFCVILGVVAIVFASNSTCSDFTIEELLTRFGQPGFLIFALCHAGVLVALLVFTRGKEKIMRGAVSGSAVAPAGAASASLEGGQGQASSSSASSAAPSSSSSSSASSSSSQRRTISEGSKAGEPALAPSKLSGGGSSHSMASATSLNSLNSTASASAAALGMSSSASASFGLHNLTIHEQFSLRLAYPLVASLFAAWTVLLSKAVGELAKNAFRSDSAASWRRFESWVIVVFFLVSCPSQILYMQKGLQFFEAMYIVPIFSSCWLVGSIMMGALFWGDFVGFQAWQYVLFFFGVGLIVFGIVLLQRRGMGVKGGMQVAPAMTGSAIMLKEMDQGGGGEADAAAAAAAAAGGEEERDALAELGISVLTVAQEGSGSKLPIRPRSAPMRYKVPAVGASGGGGAGKQ